MDERRYSHIVALADEGSFNAAAQRVHLSQPAFSRSIQAAEAELGMQLFVRSSKGIRCTAAGDFVVSRLRSLLHASSNLQRDVAMFRDGQVGDLHFGMGPVIAAALLAPLLRDMRVHYPAVRVRAVVQHPSVLLEQLRRQELEFIVSDRRFLPAGLDTHLLAVLPGAFFVRTGHPLLRSRKVRMPDLAPYGLATGRLPRALQEALRRAMGVGEADELPLAVQCDELSALKSVTAVTDLVLPATRDMLQHELATGALRELAVHGVPPELTSQPAIVLEGGRAFTPAGAHAAQFLRRIARESTGQAA
ncbi:LysR family transcriptional regulator [Ramlibacter sp. PS3R-8]|uniref:LysR family transcriptional regulator n=1 Tax=Ramlibacter sp. PS3R-8 TaxID=3133437 RepID=UPI003098E06B